MSSFFTTYTTKREVFVCNGDNLVGFYAALGLQQSKQFQKVVCGVSDRDDEFSRQLEKEGIELKEWNLKDRRSIENALRNINHVLLIPQARNEMVEETRNILEACKSADVKTLGFWTCLGTEEPEGEHLRFYKMLKEIQEMVHRSDIQNVWIAKIGFAQQILFSLSHIIQDRGILPLPVGRGKFAPVNLIDCGRASAHLMHRTSGGMEPLRHQTYTFTGTEMVTGRKLVEHANRVLQSEIEFQEISDDDFRKILKETRELNDIEIEGLVEMMMLVRENKLAKRSEDLVKLLEGRKPTDIETFFKNNADAFRPGGGRIRRFVAREARREDRN